MTYDFRFKLKNSGIEEWSILSEKGHVLHVLIRCGNASEAMERAKAWASSWRSASVEFIDEQGDKRDPVPSKA